MIFKIYLILSLGIFSLGLKAQDYELGLFCQDMNVVLMKLKVHGLNIANKNTTRTAKGGYYKRKLVKNCLHGHCDIIEDKSPPILIYDPEHPDAKENGYVETPPFSAVEEMTELIKGQRAYEVLVLVTPFETIDLVIGKKLDKCFKKYKYFKDGFNIKAYLGR